MKVYPEAPPARAAGSRPRAEWLAASPLAAALGALVAIFVAYLATAALFGGLGQLADPAGAGLLHPGLVFNLVLTLILVFTLWSGRREPRLAVEDLDGLRPVLRASQAEFLALRESARSAATGSWPGLLIGAAVGAAIHEIGTALALGAGVTPWPEIHSHWNLALLMLLFGAMGLRTQASLSVSRLFSDLGRSRTRIDLLAPASLRPFGRRGLRLASYWFLGSAIASLLFVDSGSAVLVAAVISGTLALGVLSLLLPCRGVHQRLRQARRGELARVRLAVAERSAGVFDPESDLAERAPLLASLLVYEERLEGVREWPFDTPTLGRFVLFLLVPLGSWLGGAVVERLVDAVLER